MALELGYTWCTLNRKQIATYAYQESFQAILFHHI